MDYEDAVKKIRETGSIHLNDLRALKYDDLFELVEEIKKWCVYANGNVSKLKKSKSKKYNRKSRAKKHNKRSKSKKIRKS